ncbi:MAG: helix-turn-helix transcriptional regulator [Burkholderiales bacterium]|nr:helix-turn-helix transcriptional regulator [Burkholderiales bacterium]
MRSPPSHLLRAYVSHYWLCRNNPDRTHDILPDGCVDVVISVSGSNACSAVYGTTTARREVPVEVGSHYLGIRFKPGRSRHFLAASAMELTDCCESTAGLLEPALDGVPESVHEHGVFSLLDTALERHVLKHRPAPGGIDRVIDAIEAAHGMLRIKAIAAMLGKSPRQLERVFLETVGITPKLFSRIVRFRRASALVSSSPASLADIAAAAGYSDQSHMSNEFRLLGDISPAVFARREVVFLQDPP